MKGSQKSLKNDNPVVSIAANCRRILLVNFDDCHNFGKNSALYTKRFARSFASSINIAGSPLVISHNQVHKIVALKTRSKLAWGTGWIRNTWYTFGITPHGRPSGCSCFAPTSASRPSVYLSRVARINVTEQAPWSYKGTKTKTLSKRSRILALFVKHADFDRR